MNKILKVLLYLLGGVVAIVIGFILFLEIRGIPSYEAKDPGFKVNATPEMVANGKKTFTLLCSKCHLDPATGAMTGKLMVDLPKLFGEIHSKNITQDKTNGIGSWTDGQIAYMLRTGVAKNGQYIPIYMPKFTHISDDEMGAIIAFLHSDDPWVKAQSTPNVESKPSLFTKFLCFVAFKPLNYPEKVIMAPDTNNKVAYGKYLATGKYECYQCHSKDFATNNIIDPEKSVGLFGGSNKLITMEGKVILSANITMDKETGIGNWTEEQFSKAVRFGMSPHGPTRYPMDPWSLLTEQETSAIYAYLKTVPNIHNQVSRALTEQ